MTAAGPVFEAAAQHPFWEWALGVPLRITIVVAVALVVQWILIRLINRVVRRMASSARKERLGQSRRAARTAELSALLMSERREQRAEAIGSLLRSVVRVAVWSIATLTVLPELGVQIAPLLASAGVVGVALGFGAQTLVKDYLSGIFLILEDQFGVGDVIDVGPVIGTVEEVTLRVTRLRDPGGVVWYIRNGEILRVANRSQGWMVAVVDVPVGYDEDLDRVREIVEAVAEDMDTDERYDDMLLSRPEFAGVESVSGDAMFLRITARAVPQQTVPLTRVIRERLKLAFDRAGIRVPILARPPIDPATGTAFGTASVPPPK